MLFTVDKHITCTVHVFSSFHVLKIKQLILLKLITCQTTFSTGTEPKLVVYKENLVLVRISPGIMHIRLFCGLIFVCVRACVRACAHARACVCVCVCVCVMRRHVMKERFPY